MDKHSQLCTVNISQQMDMMLDQDSILCTQMCLVAWQIYLQGSFYKMKVTLQEHTYPWGS